MNTKYCLLLSLRISLGLVALTAFGQISQNHPELCGNQPEGTTYPANLTAASSSAKTDLLIRLANSTTKIEMAAVQSVEQVCKLAGDRMLVFGRTGEGGYAIYLIASSTGQVIDSFIANNPAVSPDQHWLVMRDWITPTSEVPVTEQYLLYDLTKSASESQSAQGASARNVPRHGRTMYPVTANNIPFENHGVLEAQVHTFPGGSFFWSADSKSVIFADRTQSGLALILVRISEEELATLLHSLRDDQVCGVLSDARLTVPRYGMFEIQATFQADGSAPCTKLVTLNGDNFARAKQESFERSPKSRSVRGKRQ